MDILEREKDRNSQIFDGVELIHNSIKLLLLLGFLYNWMSLTGCIYKIPWPFKVQTVIIKEKFCTFPIYLGFLVSPLIYEFNLYQRTLPYRSYDVPLSYSSYSNQNHSILATYFTRKYKPNFKKNFFKKNEYHPQLRKAFINIVPGVCLLK